MTHINQYIKLFFIFTFPAFLSCSSGTEGDHHDTEEDDHSHHSSEVGVIIEPEKAKEFGIEIETVVPGKFSDVIKTSGTIDSPNSDFFTVSAKKSGIITLVPSLSIGEKLVSGTRIGSISTAGLEGGDISQAALANLETSKAEYTRLKTLHDEGLVTTSTFREAERAYKEAQALLGSNNHGASSAVMAPDDGVLQNLMVKSGDFVEVGDPVATLAKNVTKILKVDLPSRLASHSGEIFTANFIPEGYSSVLKLADLNGKKISTNTSTESVNGYISLYFSFTGNNIIASGSFADVYLICGERDNVISLPREALVEIQGNKYVYVSPDDHSYEKKIVKTGASDGERIEILEGLSPGENVVTKGASIIRMAEVSSVAPPAHSHNH